MLKKLDKSLNKGKWTWKIKVRCGVHQHEHQIRQKESLTALFMLKKLDKSLNKEDKGGRRLKSYQQLRLGGYTHSPINPNVCV